MSESKFQSRIESVNQSEKSVNVWLEGEVVLSQAAALHRLLQECTSRYNSMHLHLQNINSLDISAIQLIMAARKTMLAAGKVFSLTLAVPDATGNILQNAGFDEFKRGMN